MRNYTKHYIITQKESCSRKGQIFVLSVNYFQFTCATSSCVMLCNS